MSSPPKIVFVLIAIISLVLLFTPLFSTDAASLVPCGRLPGPNTPPEETRACQICDIFELIDRIWKFLLTVLMPGVAIILYIAAGILILLYGANPGLQATGKSIFKTTTWGVIIILAAWMLTNTVMRSLAGDSLNPNSRWYEIQCGGPDIGGPPPPTQRYACGSQGCVANASGQFNNLAACQSQCQSNTCISSRRCSGNECRNSPGVTAVLSCMSLVENVNVAATTYQGSHSCNSCHFGGRSCTDGSHALDYGRNGLAAVGLTLEQAKGKVERCGASTRNSVACFYEDSSSRRLSSSLGADHIHCNVNNSACGCN